MAVGDQAHVLYPPGVHPEIQLGQVNTPIEHHFQSCFPPKAIMENVVSRRIVGYNSTCAPRAIAKGSSGTYKGGDMSGQIGEQAPDFTLPSVSEGDISLSQYRGEKYVILSFHVFDFTSG